MHHLLSQQVRVYRPDERHELGWFQTWIVMARNMVRSRELIWQLFRRDFLASYKKSFLGITWVFIAPVLGILSWVLLQQTGVLNAGTLDIPYPAFVLIGTTMWGLFMGFYNAAQGTLEVGKSIVMWIHYPREALLIKQVAEQLANFTITLAVTLLVLLVFGVWPAWQAVLLPLVALPLFFLGAGIGLIGSLVAVVAIDLTKLANVVLGLLMWITPIIYADNIPHPLLQSLIEWNPLTYLVCSARDIVLYGRLYEPTGYLIAAGLSFLIFITSWRLFFVSEGRLTERMI